MAVAELERPKVVRGLPGATVLHIIPALTETPAARAAVDTAVALLRSGARVIVAAEDGPLNSELQGLGGEWVRLVTESANPIATSRNARTIANLVATERVDLVHAVGIGASRSAAALKKRAGVWLVHSYATADLTRPYRDRPYSRALAAGDRVIVPSQYVADQVAARHQVPREKLAVISRRIDGARFDPPAISPERAMVLRRGWKIGRGQRVVLVPGRIDPAKGQLTLVEAARILTNGGLRGVVFVLAGDNRPHFDYAKKIAAQAEAHGVAHLIRQIGVCPDMAGAYLAADFVAIPQIEPPAFPLAAAEAMAMARPVIATHVGALPGDRAGAAERARIGAHRLARRAGRSGELRARDRGGARRRSLDLRRDRSARAAAGESIFRAGPHCRSGARSLREPVRRPRLTDFPGPQTCE